MGSFYPLEDDTQLRNWAYKPDSFKGEGQDFQPIIAKLDRANLIPE